MIFRWGVLLFDFRHKEHVMEAACIVAVTMLAFSQSALADAVYYCITKTDFHVRTDETVSYKPVTF